ncbi:MAG TPA: desulfoferrodoxin family protein [Coriobacteriia bacterium]|nr:desulfoferrodoxin family protein [Coriobacteriia bacterium]
MSDAPILGGLNRVADPESAGDFENKHTPNMECTREGDKLRVHVWMGHGVPHPNQPDHFIEWIDVLVNDLPVERFTFGAVVADPDVTCLLNVEPGSKLTAIESCNLHGLWAWDVTAP